MVGSAPITALTYQYLGNSLPTRSASELLVVVDTTTIILDVMFHENNETKVQHGRPSWAL